MSLRSNEEPLATAQRKWHDGWPRPFDEGLWWEFYTACRDVLSEEHRRELRNGVPAGYWLLNLNLFAGI